MYTPPPNSRRVAEQSFVVVNGSVWQEPPADPLFTAGAYPAERPGRVRPFARPGIPAENRALVLLTARAGQAPPPEPELLPHQDNVFPSDLSLATLRADTAAGRLVWTASDKGSAFVAAGTVLGGPLAGWELCLTLARQGNEYVLSVTPGRRPPATPAVRQRNGWLWCCPLGRLWAAAERSVAARPA